MRVKLGANVKDRISGFEGVAVSRTEYLYGCVRVGVEGTTKPGESLFFDEQRLIASRAPLGGDMPTPPSMNPK